MSTAVPIILCGKSPQIAAGVKKALAPAFEVVHVIYDTSSGINEIPTLLTSSRSSSADTGSTGSHNETRHPAAVVLGAGYDDDAVEKMRKACDERGTGSNVPWLKADMDIPRPPLGPKYGEAMTKRVKVCLQELEEEGRMTGDGVYYY